MSSNPNASSYVPPVPALTQADKRGDHDQLLKEIGNVQSKLRSAVDQLAAKHKPKCKRRVALLEPIKTKCVHLHLICPVCHPCTCASILDDVAWKYLAVSPVHYCIADTVDDAARQCRAELPRRLAKNKGARKLEMFRVHPETKVVKGKWEFPGQYAPVALLDETKRVNSEGWK